MDHLGREVKYIYSADRLDVCQNAISRPNLQVSCHGTRTPLHV